MVYKACKVSQYVSQIIPAQQSAQNKIIITYPDLYSLL